MGQMAQNFQVYFIHINFSKKPYKKHYNRAKELLVYCDTTMFVFRFFITYLPKKMETEKWPNAADSPLLQLNIADSKKKYQKHMLAGILLHIIELKTMDSHKSSLWWLQRITTESRVNITYF